MPKPPKMNVSRVYISGPIAGKVDGNYDDFRNAELEWSTEGWIVENPREYTENMGKSWEECIKYDLAKLLTCDAVAVLPDWFHSRGASLEVAVAKVVGLPIYGAFSGAEIKTTVDENLKLPPVATKETYDTAPKGPSAITLEAHDLVNGSRQGAYGHPLSNFNLTAKLWSVILDTEVTAEQVGLMMIGLKLAREMHAPKRDNLVDIAGYAETLDLIAQERTRRPSV